MNKSRNGSLVIILLLAIGHVLAFQPLASASATNVYVTPTGSASGICPSGTTSAPNLTPAQFNASSHWGLGTGQIGPGTTILLCGTFTGTAGATELTFQASGTSGNPITLLFDTNAQLNAPYWASSPNGGCGGAICIYGRSYITINGGSNGIIQNTDNGDNLTYQQSSEAIEAMDCSDCTIENIAIANIYIHTANGNTSFDQTSMRCISFYGSNWTIANNTMHDAGWCLVEGYANGDSNVSIYNNKIYNIDHGWTLASDTAGGSSGPFNFYGNYIYNYANWDTTDDVYHHDGIHCFTAANGSAAHITQLNIYNNLFSGPAGNNITAYIFIEGGSGSTPCADSTSDLYIYNNVFFANQSISNGVMGIFTGDVFVFNNTLIGPGEGVSDSIGFMADNDVSNVLFENNAVTSFNTLMAISDNIPFTADYNSYGNGGSNAFACQSNLYNMNQFSDWKSCIGGDSHSTYSASLQLTSTGEPESGSAVIGTGTNLTSLGIAELDLDTSDGNSVTPVERPTTGAWDTGAFQFVEPTMAGTPTFSPIAGSYTSAQDVTISTASSGAIICYNTSGAPATNGSTGCTSGTLYTGPISVAASETLYAVAGGTGLADSSVGSAIYTIGTVVAAEKPKFTPIAGSYTGTQMVTVSSTSSGAIICYNTSGAPATNGLTGCTSGTLYSGAVSVASSETLYAVAGGTGFTDSSVGSAIYTITTVSSIFTLSASTPTAVAPGSSATSTLTVSTATGYVGTVTLACALTSSPIGATDLPNCSFLNGSTVTLASGSMIGTPTPTATVTTTAVSSSGLNWPKLGNGKRWAGTGSGTVLALLVFLGIPARRRSWRAILGVLALMVALGSLTACDSVTVRSSTQLNSGTTAGNYTFTVTGTGNPAVTSTPTTTFTLTVN